MNEWMAPIIGVLVLLLILVTLGLWLLMPARSAPPGQPQNLGMQDPLLREEAIEECVGEFKEGLARLSKRYPELQGVEQFTHTYLGFTYVNNTVTPRVHISLKVLEGPLERMRGGPAIGWEELKDVGLICALQLEAGPNAELRAEVEKLYIAFKAALVEKLGD